MQDRYAGDVGDFGKFGLLRHLCGETADDKHLTLKPGVIWHRVADEAHNADGCHICYLQKNPVNDRRFGACDKTLYDALARMVFKDHDRSITALERADLLPNATYCRDDVRHGRKHSTCPRDDWFQDAYEKTAGYDLVFLDPDNGIECAKLLPAQAKSRKYVFRCEVGKLIKRGQSVVVYHHTGFSEPPEAQVTRHLGILADQIVLPDRPFGVLFHRGATRAFLILPVQKHHPVLLERTNALVQKWGKDELQRRKPRPHFTGPIF